MPPHESSLCRPLCPASAAVCRTDGCGLAVLDRRRVGPGRTSWTSMLDAVRLRPTDDATAVTADQLRAVVARLVAAGHWRPGDPDIRYGTARAASWDRLHPWLTRRTCWIDHQGDLPAIEGTLIRLRVDHPRRTRAVPGRACPLRVRGVRARVPGSADRGARAGRPVAGDAPRAAAAGRPRHRSPDRDRRLRCGPRARAPTRAAVATRYTIVTGAG